MSRDLWMRPKEAASYIDVQEQTLAKWRCLSQGPPYTKVGRSVRYSRQRLDEWLDAATVETSK